MNRCALIFAWLLVCFVPPAEAQEETKAADVTLPSISIKDFETQMLLGGNRDSWLMRISVFVTVTNETAHPIDIDAGQFELLADKKSFEFSESEHADPLESVTLKPAESVTGWVTFAPMEFSGKEPRLLLKWSPSASAPNDSGKDAKTIEEEQSNADESTPAKTANGPLKNKSPANHVEVDMNQAIRKHYMPSVKAVGPDGELQIISVSQGLDTFAAWALGDLLQELSVAGSQRLLFVPAEGADVDVKDEFQQWLSRITEGSIAPTGFTTGSTVWIKPGLTFKSIALANFGEPGRRSFRMAGSQVPMYSSVEDGVCAVLTPVYRFVPLEKAVADLKNPNAGVRRAAMAGAVDRLTAEQASAILEQARSNSESMQLEVASYLNLVPGKASVDALREMCLGGNEKVAAVALRSLAQSNDDSAESAMAEIWTAGKTSPKLQSETLKAIVEFPDDRWMPLVSDYVLTFLTMSTREESGVISNESIPDALQLLSKQDDSATTSELRRKLLQIKSPATQDLFLRHLLASNGSTNDSVIHECISQRIERKQISQVIAEGAAAYRDSSWTSSLLSNTINDDDEKPHFVGDHLFLYAALQCASSEQLEEMVQNIEQFELNDQVTILQHLVHIEHGIWRKLAADLISTPNERTQEIVQLLGKDASEGSLAILRNRLELYVASLEGTRDASIHGNNMFRALMDEISNLSHPECRRLMNRLARDSNTSISTEATRRKAAAFQKSFAFRAMLLEMQQRRQEKIADADETLKQCIDLDPLLPEAYLRRASAHMHAARFRESMADLKIADRLSPEDVEIQSMIALVMIRLDDIEKGLEYAEDVIEMAPKDWTSLYNGACTFARAMESSVPSSQSKLQYGDRAIQLLRQTAALKFSDSEHMLKDPDLVILHDHAEWQAVVDLVNANKETLPEVR